MSPPAAVRCWWWDDHAVSTRRLDPSHSAIPSGLDVERGTRGADSGVSAIVENECVDSAVVFTAIKVKLDVYGELKLRLGGDGA